MFGQQPYFYQPQPQRPYDYGPQLKGRYVSSIDEVRAAQIDFDGSMFVYPDVVNKKVYTKQFNLDGTVGINTYALAETPLSVPSMDDFVTRGEFSVAVDELKSLIDGGKNARPKKYAASADDEFPSF